MKQPLDKFSKQATVYKKFRPTYPNELFEYIYAHVQDKNTAWDCATGNGQVATILANAFKKVVATDISAQQLKHAKEKANIKYSLQRAEKTNFLNKSIDLITVAQALHWFDFAEFNKEANRVLKPNGTIAIWGYGLMRVEPKIDLIIEDFYHHVIGTYWDEERKYIDFKYKSIPFDFIELEVPIQFQIKAKWTLQQMEGYFNSWSAVANYKEQHRESNPVDILMKHLSNAWDTVEKNIIFPIFLRIGKPKI